MAGHKHLLWCAQRGEVKLHRADPTGKITTIARLIFIIPHVVVLIMRYNHTLVPRVVVLHFMLLLRSSQSDVSFHL
jgi:hypothetical protein